MVSLIARDHALGMVEEIYQGMLYIVDFICASLSYVLGYVSNGLAFNPDSSEKLDPLSHGIHTAGKGNWTDFGAQGSADTNELLI
jgi:hypothetical protein